MAPGSGHAASKVLAFGAPTQQAKPIQQLSRGQVPQKTITFPTFSVQEGCMLLLQTPAALGAVLVLVALLLVRVHALLLSVPFAVWMGNRDHHPQTIAISPYRSCKSCSMLDFKCLFDSWDHSKSFAVLYLSSVHFIVVFLYPCMQATHFLTNALCKTRSTLLGEAQSRSWLKHPKPTYSQRFDRDQTTRQKERVSWLVRPI